MAVSRRQESAYISETITKTATYYSTKGEEARRERAVTGEFTAFGWIDRYG